MRQQRVPVIAQIEVRFVEPVVVLVYSKQGALAGLLGKERRRTSLSFQNDILASSLLKEIAHLQTSRASAENEVFIVFHVCGPFIRDIHLSGLRLLVEKMRNRRSRCIL